MELLGIFPKPVGISVLGRELSTEELLCIQDYYSNKIKYPTNHGTDDQNVLDNNVLLELKKDITNQLQILFKETYAPLNDTSIYITLSWFNWTEQNEQHHVHTHQNSFLSGVYYVETCDQDTISFYTDDRQCDFDIGIKQNNPFNSQRYTIPAKKGSIIFFPSKLAHGVDVKQHGGTRCSLAFNTWLSGTIGSHYGGNTLHL